MNGMSEDKSTQNFELSPDLANDIQEAVEKTFGQMFGMKITSTFSTTDTDQSINADVTAILFLNSNDDPKGALIFSFPQDMLLNFLRAFYKTEFTEINATAMGAVGEISNIIYCVFKQRTRDRGIPFGMAIPQMSAGAGPRVPNTTLALCGVFRCDAGAFKITMLKVKSSPLSKISLATNQKRP